jgi:hypothetical protein
LDENGLSVGSNFLLNSSQMPDVINVQEVYPKVIRYLFVTEDATHLLVDCSLFWLKYLFLYSIE